MTAPDDEGVIWSEAVYGTATRQPLVKISGIGAEVTITADDARQLGTSFILTAMAAEADAFLVEFLQEKVGQPIEVAVQILADFRRWRVEKGHL